MSFSLAQLTWFFFFMGVMIAWLSIVSNDKLVSPLQLDVLPKILIAGLVLAGFLNLTASSFTLYARYLM